MADSTKNKISNIASFAKENIDVNKLKERVSQAGDVISDRAADIRENAISTKEAITEKLTELDRMLEDSITEYNDTYTLMNDKGIRLFVERKRALDLISYVEVLVNSIANKPKSFETDFEEINICRKSFTDSCDFADMELKAAREAAGGAGAGLAAGASVAFMAPTAAMWVATTFGTASTGAAISTLSGAAATNAALAWLGGGALTAGGGGMFAGNALLAMAGPVGWTIAGATLLSSILILTKKKTKLNKQKNEEIESVKRNTESIREIDAHIRGVLVETDSIRELLNSYYIKCMSLYCGDYSHMNDEEKQTLGALVNNTKALSAVLSKVIEA